MAIQPGVGYTFTASSQGENFNVIEPWQPIYVYPEADVCPFTIVDVSDGTTFKFYATPGMVNSIIPQIGVTADPTKRLDYSPTPTTTWNFDTITGYSYVYLKVSADYSSSPTIYPVTTDTDILYPRIISTSSQQYATDDSAFFLLATATQDPTSHAVTVTQLTCGSQWSDRIKLGSSTARYYFARA
jgi:hypothetical protein